ncbi:unnamed protein product [Rotaria sp. Silwood2]|nr:unnamed protein product [Rotaria sp. Silwood2]
MPIQLSDFQKIGLGLSIFGVGFIFLGMIFLFDKGLLAVGNILFLAGLSMIIGFERTFRFFFQRTKIKATFLFFGGIAIVLFGWPLIGMIFELYGFFLLFGGFIPIAINFLRRLPIIGSILLLPGIRQVVDSSFYRYRYDLLFRQNVNSSSKRTHSTSTPPPSNNNSNQSVPLDKNASTITTVLKVRPCNTNVHDVPESYTDNKLITAVRAMHEYLLSPSALETLQQYKTRSPYTDVADISRMLTVYRRGDVEKRAYEVWGSPENLKKEKIKRAKALQNEDEGMYLKKITIIKAYQK